jgi:hypothetical protein
VLDVIGLINKLCSIVNGYTSIYCSVWFKMLPLYSNFIHTINVALCCGFFPMIHCCGLISREDGK